MVTIQGYIRGNLVEWDADGKAWRYPDTGEDATLHPRPCPHCGVLMTISERDACLPYIDGATGACCGHNVHRGYVTWPGIAVTAEWWQRAYLKE